MSDAIIEEFLQTLITGNTKDYSQAENARRNNANDVLKDFTNNLEHVNSVKDFDAMDVYANTLNPYIPENIPAIKKV